MTGSFLIKRVIIIGLLIFLLLLLSALYFSSRAKSYADEVQFLLTQSTNALTTFKKKDASSALEIFQQLKKDAQQVKKAINSRPTPKGGERLSAYAVAYVDEIDGIANRGILAYKYLAKISKDIKTWRQALREIKQAKEPNEKAKILTRATEIAVRHLQTLAVPTYLKPTHARLTRALKDLGEKSRAVYEAGEAADYLTVNLMLNDWQISGRTVDSIFKESVKEVAEQILPLAKRVKLKKLAENIDQEIAHLQKTGQISFLGDRSLKTL